MQSTSRKPEPMITPDELATRWAVGRNTIYDLMTRKRHPLPAYKIGRRWSIDPHQAQAWLESEQGRAA